MISVIGLVLMFRVGCRFCLSENCEMFSKCLNEYDCLYADVCLHIRCIYCT